MAMYLERRVIKERVTKQDARGGGGGCRQKGVASGGANSGRAAERAEY